MDRLTVKVRDLCANTPIAGATVSLYNDQDELVDEKITDPDEGAVVFEFDVSNVSGSEGSGTFLGQAFPNPFSSRTTLPLSTEVAGDVTVALYDMLGRSVLTTSRYLTAGPHQVEIDLQGLPAGHYIVRAVVGDIVAGTRSIMSVRTDRSGTGEISLGSGQGYAGADRAAAPSGTYRVEISHPDYWSMEQSDVTITGKVLQTIHLESSLPVPEFGKGDPTFEVIADARSGLDVPRDLEFHPDRPYELWVVNRAFDGTVTYYNAGQENMEALRVRDGYAFHFMEEVSAIAFGVDGLFGTAQESINTYDNQSAGNNFMGPALWDSDTAIYSKNELEGWGDLGSHLDMLHESPNGMGIAHDRGNAYWYFDGYYGNIVYYNFWADHGPGWDDHSDGVVRRYVDATVTRVPDIPGHMVLDKETGWLYIADPGGRRVTRLDTKSGSRIGSGNIDGSQMEPLTEYSRYGNATYEVFAGENLTMPSGIALKDGRLFVGDNATGEIIVYDLEGNELRRIQTPAESLMGLEVGPDCRLWYVDAEKNQVVRINPGTID